MKSGVVVLARYGSTRFPGKALAPIAGRPLLAVILDRLERLGPSIPIVIATTREPQDDRVAQFCRWRGIPCFRGSRDNVARRFLEAAESIDLKFAVRINGDNLFVDPGVVRTMLGIAQAGKFDLVTNVPRRTFPYGMSVEVLQTSFFRRQLRLGWTDSDQEHVTSWFYENPEIGNRYVFENSDWPNLAGHRFAIDYPEDLERAQEIVKRLGLQPHNITTRDLALIVRSGPSHGPWRLGKKPMLIAEIGGNHEGDFDYARDLAHLAIASGVECVKFQIYSGDTLVSPLESPARYQHFKRFELTRDQHIALAEICRSGGVLYSSSVWSPRMLEWIDPFLTFYKVGSGDLTAWPLLRLLAERGKPIVLSTGLAGHEEVRNAVAQIRAVDDAYFDPAMLCLLQCTSMYPIPDEEAGLAVMETYRSSFGTAVGYSDHTTRSDALLQAAGMGASVLEFHFTDTREGKVFRDHQVSLTPQEVMDLRSKLNRAQILRGDGVKRPQSSEIESGHIDSFRRAAYVRRRISEGESIRSQDIVLLRPNLGSDARDAERLVGAVALRNLEAYQALHPGQDIELNG
ncbi:MAG: N-acetylneuraminate synthase family protein [Rhodothermales bacterium]|nr:N-acetylneuraminate synthase family protein [Rhodothermales bacterium]MBO6781028.1 N-acetylneuraminate synthase family protein [Rhodothermales bacterium]